MNHQTLQNQGTYNWGSRKALTCSADMAIIIPALGAQEHEGAAHVFADRHLDHAAPAPHRIVPARRAIRGGIGLLSQIVAVAARRKPIDVI
jgi:hypothetical protein